MTTRQQSWTRKVAEQWPYIGITFVVAAVTGGGSGFAGRAELQARIDELVMENIGLQIDVALLKAEDEDLHREVERANQSLDDYIIDHDNRFPPQDLRNQIATNRALIEDHEIRLRMGGL